MRIALQGGRDRFGPNLPELLAPGLRRLPAVVRWALAVVAAVVVVGGLYTVLRPAPGETAYVRRGPPVEFNFLLGAPLVQAAPEAGQLVRVERRRDGLFVDSFAVSALTLPPYRGEATGVLPVLASREIDALRRRFREFELIQEGKARVIATPGYQIVFRARLGKRRLYGREVLLPEPVPGSRRGVTILMLATPAAGVGQADDVGTTGPVKQAFRSFRFGTERP